VGGLVTVARDPAAGAAQFTLPGGQPAYVGMGSNDTPHPFGPQAGLRTATLLVPWSNAIVEFNLDRNDLTLAIATIRTTPMPPGRLTLHTDAVSAYLVPATDQPFVSRVEIEHTKAMRILTRLRALTDVVPPGQECGTTDDRATAIYLFPSSGPMMSNDLVVITEADTCAQATSLLGGRVWVPRGLIDELHTMASAR
jgi:hypothetical protein